MVIMYHYLVKNKTVQNQLNIGFVLIIFIVVKALVYELKSTFY